MKNHLVFASLWGGLLAILGAACGPPPTAVPATPTSQPTAVPTLLSEADLAALIAETTAAAAQTAATAVSQTTTSSSESITTLHTLAAAIAQIQAQTAAYQARYGAIAGPTGPALAELAAGWEETAVHTTQLITRLEAEPPRSSTQINAAAEAIAAQVTAHRAQAAAWLTAVTTHIAERDKQYANTPPQASQIAYNRVEGFSQAHDFADALAAALSDDRLTLDELAALSQLAATAEASLANTGDPQLITLARQIDDLAGRTFRGEWPAASDGLLALKRSLPRRPGG